MEITRDRDTVEGTPAVSQPKGGRDAVTRRQSVESWFQTEESQEGRETERVERERGRGMSVREKTPQIKLSAVSE